MTRLRLRGIAAPALVLLTFTGCGSDAPPSAPSPLPSLLPLPVPTSTGVWKGAFAVASCLGPDCTGEPEEFTLRVQDEAGVVQLMPRRAAQPVSVNLAARTTPEGVVLTGSAGFSGAAKSAAWQATVAIRIDGAIADRFAGTIEYDFNDWRGTVRRRRPILYVAPTLANPAGNAQGRWFGNLSRTRCSGDCTPNPSSFDWLGDVGRFDLLIAQTGSRVAGSLDNGGRLEGTISGGLLTLRDEYTITGPCAPRYDGAVCSSTISLSATIDAFDRMEGTIDYRREGFLSGSPGSHYSYDASAQLAGVVRWP